MKLFGFDYKVILYAFTGATAGLGAGITITNAFQIHFYVGLLIFLVSAAANFYLWYNDVNKYFSKENK